MGDTCRCGRPLPDAGPRRWCSPACRQAAYRARRRLARLSLLRAQISQACGQAQIQLGALHGLLAEPPREEDLGAGVYAGAVRGLPELIGDLVRLAILTDRQAGTTWAQIGTVLGVSPDAARSRYGRRQSEGAAEKQVK